MCTAVLLLWKSHVVEKMVRLMDYMSSVLYGSTVSLGSFSRGGERVRSVELTVRLRSS